jgi:hypothetical protein
VRRAADASEVDERPPYHTLWGVTWWAHELVTTRPPEHEEFIADCAKDAARMGTTLFSAIVFCLTHDRRRRNHEFLTVEGEPNDTYILDTRERAVFRAHVWLFAADGLLLDYGPAIWEDEEWIFHPKQVLDVGQVVVWAAIVGKKSKAG